MNRSTECGELFAALALAKLEYKPLKKSKYNPFFKSYYADLADVIEATGEALSKHGLAIIQGPNSVDGKTVLSTFLGHKGGQWMESVLALKPEKDTPQGLGSAMTYGQRYSYQAMVGIAAEDDDGQEASTPAPKKTTTTPPPAHKPAHPSEVYLPPGVKVGPPHEFTPMTNNINLREVPPPGPYLFDMYKDEDSDELIKLLNKKEVDPAIHQDIAAKLHGKEFVIENIKKAKDEAMAEMERG